MSYLKLSMEAYDDVIKAAGLKAGAVAKVCRERGVFCAEANAEAPDNVATEDDYVEVQTDLFTDEAPAIAEPEPEPEESQLEKERWELLD